MAVDELSAPVLKMKISGDVSDKPHFSPRPPEMGHPDLYYWHGGSGLLAPLHI